MKTKSRILSIALAIIMVATIGFMTVGLTACGGEKDILVIAREDGSGTRDAFDSLVKSSDGTKLSASEMISTVEKETSTGSAMTKVAANDTAIGYISLGSLNDTVKALTVAGVEATSANVVAGTYSMYRPFVIMTGADATMTAFASDFLSYVAAAERKSVIEDEGYVYSQVDQVAYTCSLSSVSSSDSIVLRGSTSVEPLMNEFIDDYITLNSSYGVSASNFDVSCTGSSAGTSAAAAEKDSTSSNVIGMSSSSVSNADVDQFNLALDAIAVVVNNNNDAIENIEITELYDIYTGAVTKFSELSSEE